MSKPPIGGGTKKILYALDSLRQIGVRRSAKALTSKNTCKACALGMGGQHGGMTNEMDEFPSVCNKSIQAQLTDIQPAIPEGLFKHDLTDFRELSGRELERLGRLDTPLYKKAGELRFSPIGWDEAMEIAAARFGDTDPARTFFYSSGRSSNEAGFLFQLLARAYGTNNVNNCSYYCHQATSVALGTTIGTGTSTVELADLGRADCIFVIGANPSSNHPRFIHQLKACRDRGGEVIIINPAKEPGLVKFAVPKSPKSLLSGGTEIASFYLQPRIGEDMALFKGIAKALLAMGALDQDFIVHHTDGIEAFRADIEATGWEEITSRTGIEREKIEDAARRYARAKSAVFAWGMGMTHHLHGCENIEYIAGLALMRGMIGRPGAGLLPLRGHSNVQGIGTIGVKPVLPEDVLTRMEETLGVTLPRGGGLDTMASMQAASEGRIDAALLMGGNILEANPDRDWAAAALDRIGFRLCLTTTLNRSHVAGNDASEMIILPVTARDEEPESTTQESMFNFVRLSDGGIERLENVHSEVRILTDLATRLLPDGPIDWAGFARHRTIREAIADIVPGMEELRDIDVAKHEFHIRNRLIHTPQFNTNDSKAHFVTHPLPTHSDERPFRLTSLRSEGQFNSIIYEEKDSYRGTETRWSVMMHKDDITELGLGEYAHVTSDHGEMRKVRVYPFDLPKGCVMAYYPEANALTGRSVDPRSRTPSFKSTPVSISPA
ncbi:FdhF/YdeP family oxidoreductase [Parvularcula marina]|uniref:FdhF/YdeP family oxidoreductase n=1 Tax=Parvularcula marina TaxID=2292771 RepID=UPI0035173490